MPKIHLTSLGCAKNLVDSELMLGQLKSVGFVLTDAPDKADLMVVNTCGFINPAKEESINTILELVELKKQLGNKLIVSGCLTERYRSDLAKEIPEVDGFLGVGEIAEISRLAKQIGLNTVGDIEAKVYDQPYLYRQVTTPRHLAYVRISDGCNNPCTFCVIPSIRGRFKSRSLNEIVSEVVHLVRHGVREIMLIAQDLNMYGFDVRRKYDIHLLLRELSTIEDLRWIRLLYTYPAHFSDQFIDTVAAEEKICNYLDIPLQHVNDTMLRIMRRKIGAEQQRDLLYKLRERIPGLVIRTTMLVGMPGEKQRYFNEMLRFVEEFRFDKLGAFVYSPEEDTPAYHFENPVSERTKARRLDELMVCQQAISYEINKSLRGQIFEVIVDGYSEDESCWLGRTYRDTYQVDGLLKIYTDQSLQTGKFVKVKIVDNDVYDLTGELADFREIVTENEERGAGNASGKG